MRASMGFVVAQILIILIVCVAPPDARAQTAEQEADRIPGLPEPSIAMNFPRAFGDPTGIRSALAGRGVTFAVNYIGEVLGNPTGGIAQGTFYDGRLEFALTADLEKAIGWRGLSFFANVYQIHGRSITANNLGVLMPVSFIEALPSTRLFELWLEQQLLDDKLTFRFGQLAADSEFMISQGASAFLNGSWGWPSIAGINLPNGGPAYPMASPGMRLAFMPNEQLSLKLAMYSGNPAGDCDYDFPQQCNPYGLSFPINTPLVFAEMAVRYNQGDGELPGTVKFGLWRYFGNFEESAVGSAGLPIGLEPIPGMMTEHDRAYYAVWDQMIYRVPGKGDPKGVGVFGRLITSPSEGNMVSFYAEAGVTFSGLLAARPNDMLGIGIAYTGISSQIIDYARETLLPVTPSFEAMLEISYTAEIMPGLTLQPDFQYFWNPGGHVAFPDDLDRAVPNAAVFGLRSTVHY
ncbi:carbohydrate porin [Hyphomicrobium sp. D-2]|uniref:carbohydrate porin n=1 Tax=Hyphomicrobium sp. D-2 TaxID=3041621 RepID=UPI0024559443|nr:carbohydrate porin [Hyphomicrobium sp. D-2]MDH4981560.1 carbohydrate porin [Hyphomicrobium sp. D-2]